MNYLQKKKLAFMSIANQVKGFIRTIMGALPLTLEGCVDEESIIDYKLYGQSVQDGEPAPDNPIEVESVGEKTTNLIPVVADTVIAGVTISVNEFGVVTLNGTCSASTNYECPNFIVPTGIYSFCDYAEGTFPNENTMRTQIKYGDNYAYRPMNGDISKFVYSFELTEPTTCKIRIRLSQGHTYNNCKLKPTLLSGTYTADTIPEYEPYGKYKIPVTVSGRNLLSPYGWTSGTFNAGFVPSEYNYVVEEAINYVECAFEATYRAIASNMIKVSEIQKIGFKVNKNNENAVAVVMQFYDIDGNRVAYKIMTEDYMTPDKEYIIYKEGNYFKSNSDKVNALIIKSNFIYMRLFLISRQKISGLRIYDFYASKDGDAGYEPYVEPITTNIYLDEPLRKVDDYADYIDFESGKVVRAVGVVEFDGKQNYPVYALPSQNFYGFYKSISNMKKGNRQEGLCTYLYNQKKTASRIWFGVGTNNIVYFSLPDIYNSATTDIDRMQAIKDWLAGLETPFIVYYILAEETEQPISLPTIPTFKGTNIVSADTKIQPSNAEIKYYSNVKE